MCPASIAIGGRGITLFGTMHALTPTSPMKNGRSRRVFGGACLWRAGAGVALLGLCLASTGCVKTIYRRGDPRTQYDRYDASRNQFVPDYIEDEYGRLEPNLRGRLLVKN